MILSKIYIVLSITIPFFAIIFLGTFFKANKIFNDESSKNLTKFALYVTLPPFTFINIIKSSSNSIFNLEFILKFEIVTLIILVTSFFISKYILLNDNKDSSIFSLNSSFPNYGYMGIPLCILAFGEEAAIPISLIFLADITLLLTFTSLFSSKFDKNKILNTFLNIFLSLIKNPILFSVFIGFLFLLLEINIPNILFTFLNTLSLAAPPTALFALGITLWNKIEVKSLKHVSIITFFKLLIHPLLIFIAFYIFPSNVSNLWIKVALLCSCLPVAGNVFAMAIYYNSLIKITSNSILITTILSTLTVPLILFFLI